MLSKLIMRPGIIIQFVFLATLLPGPPGSAQQVEDETPTTAEPTAEEPFDEAQKPAEITPSQQPGAATRFTPSEKIRADDAVSFPVDI